MLHVCSWVEHAPFPECLLPSPISSNSADLVAAYLAGSCARWGRGGDRGFSFAKWARRARVKRFDHWFSRLVESW